MKAKKALLVIDTQKEGIDMPYASSTKLRDHKKLILNIKRLIRGFSQGGDLVIRAKCPLQR